MKFGIFEAARAQVVILTYRLPADEALLAAHQWLPRYHRCVFQPAKCRQNFTYLALCAALPGLDASNNASTVKLCRNNGILTISIFRRCYSAYRPYRIILWHHHKDMREWYCNFIIFSYQFSIYFNIANLATGEIFRHSHDDTSAQYETSSSLMTSPKCIINEISFSDW